MRRFVFPGLLVVALVLASSSAAVPSEPTGLASSPTSPANDNSPEISGSAADGSIVSIYTTSDCSGIFVATGSAADFASPGFTVSVADDSTTSFWATATDATGPSACSSDSVTYVEDSTGPSVTIDAKPSNPSNDPTPTFSVSATEGTLVCQLDGQDVACSSPEHGPLADGDHTFQVSATDAAGNSDTESYTWMIDTTGPIASVDLTAPDTAISASPANPSNDAHPRFAFTSSEAGSTFECKLDAGAFGPCTSPTGYAGLAAGGHTFQVRATDGAGNTDAAPASYTWTIDLTAPRGPRRVILTRSCTTVDSPTCVGRVRFSLTRPRGEFHQFVIRLMPAGTVLYRGAKRTFEHRQLAPGRYTYEVMVVDRANNTSAVKRVSARVRDPLYRPSDGAVLSRRRPPRAQWQRVARANGYNIQVWRRLANGRRTKVLSAWPASNRYKLRSRWVYKGAVRRWADGATYDIYVWARFGSRFGRIYA